MVLGQTALTCPCVCVAVLHTIPVKEKVSGALLAVANLQYRNCVSVSQLMWHDCARSSRQSMTQQIPTPCRLIGRRSRLLLMCVSVHPCFCSTAVLTTAVCGVWLGFNVLRAKHFSEPPGRTRVRRLLERLQMCEYFRWGGSADANFRLTEVRARCNRSQPNSN